MAIMVTNPGQYVLGGISAPRTGIAEEFQAGLRENLTRQDMQQVMGARQQAMDLTAEQAELARRARTQFGVAQGRLEDYNRGERVGGGDFLRPGLRPPAAPTTQPPAAPAAQPAGPIFDQIIPPVAQPPAAPTGPGAVSRRYESGAGGVATVSTGVGDPGGVSYGEYQIASNTGTMTNFLRSPEAAGFSAAFAGLVPGTPEFNEAYNTVVAEDPQGFAAAQRAYLERTHYSPVQRLAQRLNFNVESPAIQEALWSQSIQHGYAGNRAILQAAVNSGVDLQDEEAVIQALYEARGDYVAGLNNVPPATQRAIRTRYAREMQDVLELAKSGDDKPRGQFAPAADESRFQQFARRWGEGVQADIGPRLSRLRSNSAARGGLAAQMVGFALDRPSERATREQDVTLTRFLNSRQLNRALRANPALMDELESDPAGFMEQYGDEIMGRGAEAPEEPDAEEPPAEAPPAEAPTQQPTAGVQQQQASPVQEVVAQASARGTEPSSLFIGAPERILQGLDRLDQRRALVNEMARYYSMIGDTQGFNAMVAQATELNDEQFYLNGMVAIVGMQRGNFGPLQQLMQQQYPGQQVEVRPYTDDTVEFFLDGVPQARESLESLIPSLRAEYDRLYIESEAQRARRAADREDLTFEVTLREAMQARRELALAEANALIEQAVQGDEWSFDSNANLLFNKSTGEAYVFETRESGRGSRRQTTYVLVPAPLQPRVIFGARE